MTETPDHTIRVEVARSESDLQAVAVLFREYQQWLDQPVCFENFEVELAELPGSYSPPSGELWLTQRDGEPVAVVGMVPYRGNRAENACEMKRLYVRDSARGLGLGRSLTMECLNWAAKAGYEQVVLETFDSLHAAWSLYLSLGFAEAPRFSDKPLNRAAFLIRQSGFIEG